jgi:hypothetical protein
MKHHIQRARDVFNSRGLISLIITVLRYFPIEINNLIFRARYGSGCDVMSEDWDTLIILDACRYDTFHQLNHLEGSLEYRISQGSMSDEFLSNNFGATTHPDTVYVSTNPYFAQLDLAGQFHAVVDLLGMWDEQLETIPPADVAEAAMSAHAIYPDKRIIVHFMQPHLPFLGPTGQSLHGKSGERNLFGVVRGNSDTITTDDLVQAYEENLELVLQFVQPLLAAIDGKVVISADHGNMFGERQRPLPTAKMWGHPWGVYTSSLVKVPWHIIDGERRNISAGDLNEQAGVRDDAGVEAKLHAYGYL